MLPALPDEVEVEVPVGREDALGIPQGEGFMAEAGDDCLFRLVFIRAVVDFVQELQGGDGGSVGKGVGDGLCGLAGALQGRAIDSLELRALFGKVFGHGEGLLLAGGGEGKVGMAADAADDIAFIKGVAVAEDGEGAHGFLLTIG